MRDTLYALMYFETCFLEIFGWVWIIVNEIIEVWKSSPWAMMITKSKLKGVNDQNIKWYCILNLSDISRCKGIKSLVKICCFIGVMCLRSPARLLSPALPIAFTVSSTVHLYIYFHVICISIKFEIASSFAVTDLFQLFLLSVQPCNCAYSHVICIKLLL